MKEMFGLKRFVSQSVAEEIHVNIQKALWNLIDKRKQIGTTMDYLQVFELSVLENSDIQQIVHWQEGQCVSDTHMLPEINNPITRHIWIMDNGDYCTMLFPGEC